MDHDESLQANFDQAALYKNDSNGNRLTLTDPVGNTTTWTYDAMNRMLTNTNELLDTRSYEYDAASNLAKYTDRNGRVIEYVYDDLHRRTSEIWKDGMTTVRTLSYGYNGNSWLTSASDPAASYTFTYDNLGRNTSTTHDLAVLGFDVIIDEAYDALGRRESLAAEINGTDDLINTYSYDYLNRMTQVTQSGQTGGNSVAEKRVDFTYDAEDKGLFTGIHRYADTAGTQLVASTAYNYDSADQLTSLTHADSASSTLAGYTWTYDSANRLTAFTVYGHSAEDATYTHDDTNQLTGADRSGTTNDESYTYDANGNRTNPGHTTGSNNQLTTDGTYNYTYDDEGSRLTKTEIATGDYVEYSWDHRNRLIEILTKTSGGTVTHEVDYVYDIFGRRIGKVIDADGAGSGTAVEEIYIYDGLREERGNAGDHMLLRFDEADDLTNRFLYGPNVDQILAQEDVTSLLVEGEILWALTDHLGSVRDIVTYDVIAHTATVENHVVYDTFGNITGQTNPSIQILFGYAGRETDNESTYYYNRARYYDAAIGRWIAEDPLGFAAGDENLVRYVGNRPLRLTDPSGLQDFGPPPIPTQTGPVRLPPIVPDRPVRLPPIFNNPPANGPSLEIYDPIPSWSTVDSYASRAFDAILSSGKDLRDLASRGFDLSLFNSVISEGKIKLINPLQTVANDFENHRRITTLNIEERFNRLEREIREEIDQILNPRIPMKATLPFPGGGINYAGLFANFGLQWNATISYDFQTTQCSGKVNATFSGNGSQLENDWKINAVISSSAGNADTTGSLTATANGIEGDLTSIIGGSHTANNISVRLTGSYDIDGIYKIGGAGYLRSNFRGWDVRANATTSTSNDVPGLIFGGGIASPTGDFDLELNFQNTSGLKIEGVAKW